MSAAAGKTRLAVEAARGVRAHFADGTVLVDLAAVLDADQVVARIGAALKVTERPGRSIIDDTTFALRDRQLLLVLDDCEHVLAAVADAAQRLLQGCTQLRVMARGREPLRVAGERVYPVAPLALPEPLSAQLPSLAELSQSPAIRLFVDRALDVTPALSTQSDEERRSLLATCERLDGVPLAIEFAAARTNALCLPALEAQLDDRFHLLTRGERTALARHQTLRATLDWSYSLLAESERIAFRRLGIFVGGWTLEAARAICADGNEILRPDVLELLGSLVEKSLVVADVSGDKPRYRLLETMRAYCARTLVRKRRTGNRCASPSRTFPSLPRRGGRDARYDTDSILASAAANRSRQHSSRAPVGVRRGALTWGRGGACSSAGLDLRPAFVLRGGTPLVPRSAAAARDRRRPKAGGESATGAHDLPLL